MIFLTVKEAVKNSGTNTGIFCIGSIKEAQKMIGPNEEVLGAFVVNIGRFDNSEILDVDVFNYKNKISGVFVVTNERIFFCNSVLGQSETKSMTLKDITSMDDKTTVTGLCKLRIKGLTETFVIDMNKKVLAEMKNVLNTAISNLKNESNQTVSVKVANDPIEQLKKLSELRDLGILTEEEFESKKAEIMSRI